MEQPKYIDKNPEIPEALDFNFLRTEGIRKIQQLTGAFWTDYNIHDPGVTILEQLCYAITDLAYKTDTNIEEHIFSENNEHTPFFYPEETLTNRPITIDDYRKIFIDSIPEIKNIWFEPVKPYECGFNGLYRVLVDTSDYGIKRDTNKSQIINKVKALFSQFRNIGEDIYEIKILNELPVTVHADIETDGIHDLERILAKIYYAIEQIMAPEVKFYSLNELKSKGISYNNIFDGPRLKHGYILSDDLVPQKTTIVISDIVRSIMQIEGLVNVKQLWLEVDGTNYHSQLVIPDGKMPRIITYDLFNDQNTSWSNIKFYKGSLEYSGINHKNFKLFLNELVSENKKSFRISESSFQAPDDLANINFGEYYSIQNHFPAVYGLGLEGIPGKPNTERIAQAKQLKGYLLIFEQFMANYQVQLEHFKDLLSIDKKQDKTYFTQALNTVPNVDALLSKEKGWINDAFLDLKSVPNNYEEGIEKLNQLFDNYSDRRNRFLDYLLAVHGESLPQYTLQQFNVYHSDTEFEEFLIRCKTALLQNLGELNYSRSSGFNYMASEEHVYSGLEKRLAIFLGFGITETSDGQATFTNNESFFATFSKSKLTLIGDKKESLLKNTWQKQGSLKKYELNDSGFNQKFDIIDDDDLLKISYSDEQKEAVLKNILPYRVKQVNKAFLTDGINLNNYKIGKVNKPSSKYVLAFYVESANEWLAMGEYKTNNEALIAVKVLIEAVKQLNIESENVCAIEHILLRPAPEMQKYGIYINDASGNHILKSNKQYSLKDRKAILDIVAKHFTNNSAFYVEADENRDMNIHFEIEGHDLTFTSITPKLSVEETHKQKESLFEFLSGNSAFDSKIGLYIQYNNDSVHIPEEFYSFHVSLLFPNWSARFQNKEFQTIANDIILEQKPANIIANVEWLNPEDMLVFDDLIKAWHNTLSTTNKNDEQNLENTAKLAEFLYTKMKANQA